MKEKFCDFDTLILIMFYLFKSLVVAIGMQIWLYFKKVLNSLLTAKMLWVGHGETK